MVNRCNRARHHQSTTRCAWLAAVKVARLSSLKNESRFGDNVAPGALSNGRFWPVSDLPSMDGF